MQTIGIVRLAQRGIDSRTRRSAKLTNQSYRQSCRTKDKQLERSQNTSKGPHGLLPGRADLEDRLHPVRAAAVRRTIELAVRDDQTRFWRLPIGTRTKAVEETIAATSARLRHHARRADSAAAIRGGLSSMDCLPCLD